MNYAGSDKKFKVTTTQPDFQLTEDDFTIVIKDRYGRIRQTIPKDDCFWDTDGNYYFVIENIKQGVFYAYFMGSYEDDDYDKQRRVFTDVQKLYEVGVRDCDCNNAIFVTPICHCEHKVHYEEVFSVSIDGDDYLCGSDGKYILTSDGKRIAFKNPKRKQVEDMGKVILDTMTGEEFKQFIEGRNPDGDIDTVPEMLDAARGISDSTTIKEDVEQQMSEHDTENEATDDDIDSIFDDEENNGAGGGMEED